jgi:soluble lytic murein transglycosylase-like protein
MPRTRLLLVVLLVAAAPSVAHAQIYSWVDANGTRVLSDRKLDAPSDVYEVIGAPSYRTTTAVATTGRSSSSMYDTIVEEHATRHSLRPELVRAVIQVESGFNPHARSPVGAMGLMQLMPATARELGVTDPYDPAQNIGGGTRYLRLLLDKYAGNEQLALAAYNAGPGAVDRYGKTIPPYRETRDYVKKVGTTVGRQLSNTSTPTGSAVKRTVVYKSIEIVSGRVIPRYSTTPPASGSFERLER